MYPFKYETISKQIKHRYNTLQSLLPPLPNSCLALPLTVLQLPRRHYIGSAPSLTEETTFERPLRTISKPNWQECILTMLIGVTYNANKNTEACLDEIRMPYRSV